MGKNTPRSDSLVFRNSIPLSEKDVGVYGIINRNSNKLYVGSSLNLAHRKRQHRHKLIRGIHDAISMQSDFNKEPDSLEFVLIESINSKEKSELFSREQFWINFFKASDPSLGYNTNSNSKSGEGVKRSEEIIRRIVVGCSKRKYDNTNARGVVKMDLDGVDIEAYPSLTAASASLGSKNRKPCICAVASGKKNTAFGFRWRYA